MKKLILNIIDRLINLIDRVTIKVKGKRYSINLKYFNYMIPQVRDKKIQMIEYYLDKVKISKSYKIHLFNNLILSDQLLHKKLCLFEYFSHCNYNIQEINSF